MLGFKGEGVHEEVLSGRDASVDWEDVFNGEFWRWRRMVGGKKRRS